MAKDDNKQQTTTTMPYGSGYVDNVLGEAQRIYGDGQGGARQWTGNVMAPLNQDTSNALAWTRQLAGTDPFGLDRAQSYAVNMIQGNGMTPDLQNVASGIQGNMDQVKGYLTPFADGSMQEDPRLAAMLETNANRAANAAATKFGGGRYGSAAIGQGVGTAVADANNATMLQSNENARNRQLQASGMLASNALQAGGLLGNMYESGLGRAAQTVSMLPTLDNLRYAGAERLAGVGDYFQNRDQSNYDNEMSNYLNAPALRWADLNNYNTIVRGLGSLGGTQIKPQSSASGAQKAIGGAAAGASLGSTFGPWGSAIGGIGGGLLGAFG